MVVNYLGNALVAVFNQVAVKVSLVSEVGLGKVVYKVVLTGVHLRSIAFLSGLQRRGKL